MNKTEVVTAMAGEGLLDNASKRQDTVAVYKRYAQVKREHGENYLVDVAPFQRLVRRRMNDGEIANPLLAAAEVITALGLCNKSDRATTDLILCGAIEICLEISLIEHGGKLHRRTEQLQ